MDKNVGKLVAVVGTVLTTLFIFMFCTETVDQGTVKAAYRYGSYQYTLEPGFYIVNPLNAFHEIDTKQRTVYFEDVELPSQDQLSSNADVSIQFRALGAMAETIISDTGNLESVIDVHLAPASRSLIRQIGKSVVKAEDLFMEQTQIDLQNKIKEGLAEYMLPRGVEVQAVLLRDTVLPEFIRKAIERKKDNEQKAEQQIAELNRYKTEAAQIVAKATSEKQAAEQMAAQKRLLADAEAYQIEKEGQMLEKYPAVLKFRALHTLSDMSKDPAAKLYWLNSNSPNPLPLMHLGESK